MIAIHSQIFVALAVDKKDTDLEESGNISVLLKY